MREPLADRIAALHDRLTPAERKVADLVLADPAAVAEATLAALARTAGVSEPTVIRFCRALGLDGFAELRLTLVRGEGPPRPVPRSLGPGLPPAEAAAAVFDAASAALLAARETLDGEAVARAALALLRATRVEIWACGASFAAARHLEAALIPACRGVVARDDGALQGLAAATLDGDGVALCLSRSGADREVVDAARLAAAGGATVITLTRARSPLAAAATLLLPCEVTETATPGGTAALVQLAWAEALAATAALLAPPGGAARAERLAVARASRRIAG